MRGGSTPPPPPNQVPENRASWRTRQEDEGCGNTQRDAVREQCLDLRLEGRATGFGPGSASDYDVTLGQFLPFSGLGSSSVKCGGREG